jgi:DNA-binding transcriptional regulator YiaG
MAKLESIIKSEIQRLAKHEVRTVFRPLRKEVWGMKLKLSNLIKGFTVLDRLAKEISKDRSTEPKLEASPDEVKASRITPERIRSLRKKLGISQRELGLLIGVTTWAVLMWEKGKFKPKGEKKIALVALRKLRKRDVKKMLNEKAGSKVQAKEKKSGVYKKKKPSKKVMKKRTK